MQLNTAVDDHFPFHVVRRLFQRGEAIVFCLTLGFLAVLTHDVVFWAGNDASRFAQMEALVDYGQTSIDFSWYSWTVDRVTLNGETFSNKPPLLGIVGAGLYYLWQQLFGLTFEYHEATTVYLLTLVLVGGTMAWLAANFYTALLDSYISIRHPVKILTTVALVGGTLLTVFATTLNNHTIAAALLFVACRAAWNGWGWQAGLWLGLTFCIDIVPGLIFMPVLAFMLYDVASRRALVDYGFTLLLVAVVFIAVNLWVVGSPLPPKMAPGAVDHSYPFPGNEGIGLNVPAHFLPDDWSHPLASLFGGHGFFTVSPILLFGVAGMGLALRYGAPLRRSHTLALVSGCIAMVASHVLFIASFGGWSYGYRYLIPIVPILLFFVPMVLTQGYNWLFAGMLVVSISFALLGVYHPWPPVFEPEYAQHPKEHAVASTVTNPVGGNASAWLQEHFPQSLLTKQVGEFFISPDPEVRRQYLLLFYQSKGESIAMLK